MTTASVALVVLGLGLFVGCGNDSHKDDTKPPSAASDLLVGHWQPVSAKGVGADFPFERTAVTFVSRTRWEGNDGCNDVEGVYQLDKDGTFQGGPTPDSFDGRTECVPGSVDYYELLSATARVEVSDDSAVFMNADGMQILTLARL